MAMGAGGSGSGRRVLKNHNKKRTPLTQNRHHSECDGARWTFPGCTIPVIHPTSGMTYNVTVPAGFPPGTTFLPCFLSFF